MSKKIEIRCSHCGHYLFTKIIPEDRKDREYGGVEIPCSHCNTTNIIAVTHNKPPAQAFGERRGYYKKSA